MKNLSKMVYYFRLSTKAQADRESTIEHYKERGYKVGFTDNNIIYDIGSGSKADRKGYLKLKELASKRKIEFIALPDDLSRLTRDLAEFQEVKKLLLNTGVKLVNLSFREYKFESPEEDLQGNIHMAFAQFEQRRNKHKSIKGHQYLRENGKAIRAVFPYIKVNGVLTPNTSEYKNTGKSVWEIGKEVVATYLSCGAFHQTVVTMTEKYGEEVTGYKRWEDYCRHSSGMNKWLRSHYIRGNIHYKTADYIAYATHEPLVDDVTANKIDKLLEIGGRGRGKYPKIYNIWKGVACCQCGARMRVHLIQKYSKKHGKKNYRYLVCSEAYTSNENKLRKRRAGLEKSKCTYSATYGLTIEKMEELTIEAIIHKAEKIANKQFSESTIIIPEEVKVLQTQIKKYKLLAQEDADLIPVLNKKQLQLNQLLEGSKSNDELELDYLRKSLASFGKSKEFWNRATREEKLMLFNEYIQVAICKEGVPEFHFKV